ncbi:lipopolysaccharide biosynthesis protein [Seleniivibrio woodruffii]|uniref:lipopolysaccharide biosynthesis protein n=1 Tax=Seleniivibrio woodruffii TaxID=1078050 RepID=UPI0024095419|nr:oligosaccharide flippase family protein [Seleniivibrio woodruffii]
MKRYIDRLKSRLQGDGAAGVFRNMLILATGTTASKAIGFLASLVVTRLFTPEDFGAMSLFIAFTSLIAPLATLCYSYAIPLPKSRCLAANIIVMNFAITVFMTMVTGLVFIFAGDIIFKAANADGLQPYIWLILMTQFFGGIYETLSSFATRERAFKPIAKTKMIQSFFGALAKIVSGFSHFGVTGLLIGQAYSQAGGSFIYFKAFRESLSKSIRSINLKRVLKTALLYRDFPMYRLPSQFLLTFSIQIPLLMTGKLFGMGTVGQLGLATSVLSLPVILFGVSAGQAYYAEAARIGAHNPKELYSLSKKVAGKLFLVSLLPFAVLQLAGEPLFVLVFGKAWHQSGTFASMLSVSLLAQFVVVPIVNVLTVLGKQKMFLMFNIMRTLTIVGLFSACGYLKLTANESILAYSILLAANYGVMSLVIFRIIRSRF